jgi:hypothetical protein
MVSDSFIPLNRELKARILYSGEITVNFLLNAVMPLSKYSFSISLCISNSISANLKIPLTCAGWFENYQGGTGKSPI